MTEAMARFLLKQTLLPGEVLLDVVWVSRPPMFAAHIAVIDE